MAKSSDDRVVTVDELAAAWYVEMVGTGNTSPIYAAARQAGFEADRVDVFGRPAWSPETIAAWSWHRDERDRKNKNAAAQRAVHDRASAAWQAARTGAVDAARNAELAKLKSWDSSGETFADFQSGFRPLDPGDHAAIRAAGRHAGEQFERRCPRPRLNGKPTVALSYVDESEEGSTVARVVAAVRGPRVTDADHDEGLAGDEQASDRMEVL